MLYVSDLPALEKETLEWGFRHHKKPYFRHRCQCMLLSAAGLEVKELARIYQTRTRTIYDWIHRYDQFGFLGLLIRPGRGLKAPLHSLTSLQIEVVKAEVENNPQSLRAVCVVLSEKFGFTITKSMLKKYLKKLKYTWHRLRKWLKPRQDPLEYARLSEELKTLLQLEDQNYLKVYFGDQSGFSLDPSVPYGWQPGGKYTALVPQKSQRRNVFGLFSRDNEFEGYETFGTINTALLIAFIDDFASRITQKSVIVLDNAPLHHALLFQNKRAQWANKDLLIWFLPTYSPHLNKIETLWRKIKYEWLKPPDFLNWQTLNDALDHIFDHIGTKFTIHFT